MKFDLVFTEEARENLKDLESNQPKLKKVRKCLGLLQTDPRHPGLESHKYSVLKGAKEQPIYESYVENKTPAAWRVFWHYGPTKELITVVAITPHP